MSARSQDAPDTTLVGQLIEEYFPFAPPKGQLPDATPAEGPDPYGNPDPEWLQIDWREHLRQINLDGARVNYVELGSGPRLPLIFVHGLSGSWQNWLENIPHFAREHRVLALDLPGFGHSPLPDWEISIEGYGRLLHDFCDALAIGDCALVGNSMGGFIAAEMAIRSPRRVRSLTVVSAAVFWQGYKRAQPLVGLARLSDAYVARALTRTTDSIATRPRLRTWALATAGFRYPHLISRELAHEMVRSARRTDGFLPALEALADYPLDEELPKIDCPTDIGSSPPGLSMVSG